MPPFIPHKRRLSTPPSDSPTPSKRSPAKKPSLFDTADKPSATASLQDNKAFLNQLDALGNDESALSDISSDEFEDVDTAPSPKRRKVNHHEAEDDDIDWEDAIQPDETEISTSAADPSGDLEITLGRDVPIGSFTDPHDKKKGPSKVERQIRVATHCAHVQFLIFHNLIRNGWACDKEVQKILVGQLPASVKKEVEKWKVASGFSPSPETVKASVTKRKSGKKAAQNERNQRDWGKPAERQDRGAPNTSRGDPILRLLNVLAAYWRKRFTITAPGLRKQGYNSLAKLEEELASYKNEKHDPEEHGERISTIQEFRNLAKTCEGSRDVGAQLFVALIRGLGIDARLVASLQPIGFGWSKAEEASARRKKTSGTSPVEDIEASNSDEHVTRTTSKPSPKAVGRSKKRPSKGAKEAPIDLSEDSENRNISENESDDDNASVIDVTPSTPRRRPSMNYDRDMPCPAYWTEVVSPISNEVYPVDPLILTPAVASNSEQLPLFEPRGAKADKAKQVIAYVVAYSDDGTAKEVTTRYLKRHMWPGRTKGTRIPVEKVPIYNKRGKIKHYEDYDWFKTVMSGYGRTHKMRTVVDDLEDAKDLKAAQPEKKEIKANEETLQGYKTSAKFVLERHLRREEALRPGSKPIKTFATGKGDNAKEEPVYSREDVEVCRTGESWHKEGRVIKDNELPMKMVPVRAVTLTRKREVEEAERDTGEKPKQGLYAWNQTVWISAPPIENGIIPRNKFGNIDCYVPTMVPKGAVHIPRRNTVRICKRLGCDYAEAVTGFEFGNKRAIPVITGVVVAEENERAVIDEWEKEEAERRIKEEGKREKTALSTWRKWLMGLRIVQRVREEYGEDADAHMKEEMNPFTNRSKATKATRVDAPQNVDQGGEASNHIGEDLGGGFFVQDDFGGGGFLPEGHDEEELPQRKDELIIEDDKRPAELDHRPSIKPSVTALEVDGHDRHDEDESQQPIGEDIHKLLMKRKSKSKPTMNAEGTKKTRSTTTKILTTKKALKNGKKCKASTSPEESEVDEASDKKKSSRAAPKRKAARKSENAVKSHYFEHGSDDDEVSSDRNEVNVAKRPPKKKKTAEPVASRRGRPRKSM